MQRDDLDIEAIAGRLRAERAELLESSDATAGDRKPVTLDQQSVGRLSRMDAMQVQAMAQAVDDRRKARLALIDAALRRIEEGAYGICAGCEEDIPAKRLEADPTVTRCVDCAE